MTNIQFDVVINKFNSLVFTIVNKGYIDIGTNFIQRAKQINIFNKMIFVCTDQDSYQHFTKESYIVSVYRESNNVGLEFVEWKDKEYHNLVFNKFDITKEMLEYAQANNASRVLYIDTDIWCFTNFETALFELSLNTYPDADFIMQDGENYRLCPVPISFQFKDGNLITDRISKRHCTGFMLMQPTLTVISVFDYKQNDKVDYNKFVGNQPYFNFVITTRPDITVIDLNRSLGVNGSLFNDEGAVCRLTDEQAIQAIRDIEKDAWFLHYTYISGKQKIIKMKQFNHWLL
jgi:hypothetical protein